jgi:Mrp family chromosome partitioning ATPase
MQGSELNVACDGLLAKIFQRQREESGRGFVVALTSAHPGAGVTHITNALAVTLNRGGERHTRSLSSRYMPAGEVSAEAPKDGVQAELWQRPEPGAVRDNWHGVHTRMASYFEKLRQEYRYILIDCPSLREAEHAVMLASLVDGVVIVVEANRTQNDQFLYAEQTIENAGGRILGHVLNKRTYVIPAWLHRRMEAVGI